MSLSQKNIILLVNVVLLWMLISTMIVSTFWISASLTIVLAGAVKYFRIKPVPQSRTSERVRNLFQFDTENYKNNTIFHKAGGLHAPENTLEAIAQVIERLLYKHLCYMYTNVYILYQWQIVWWGWGADAIFLYNWSCVFVRKVEILHRSVSLIHFSFCIVGQYHESKSPLAL